MKSKRSNKTKGISFLLKTGLISALFLGCFSIAEPPVDQNPAPQNSETKKPRPNTKKTADTITNSLYEAGAGQPQKLMAPPQIETDGYVKDGEFFVLKTSNGNLVEKKNGRGEQEEVAIYDIRKQVESKDTDQEIIGERFSDANQKEAAKTAFKLLWKGQFTEDVHLNEQEEIFYKGISVAFVFASQKVDSEGKSVGRPQVFPKEEQSFMRKAWFNHLVKVLVSPRRESIHELNSKKIFYGLLWNGKPIDNGEVEGSILDRVQDMLAGSDYSEFSTDEIGRLKYGNGILNFKYYTQDKDKTTELALYPSLQLNMKRRRHTRQILIIEREKEKTRIAELEKGLKLQKDAKGVIEKEDPAVGAPERTEAYKTERKKALASAIEMLNQAFPLLEKAAEQDRKYKEAFSTIEKLSKLGQTKLDSLTYPLNLTLPTDCNYNIVQSSKSSFTLFFGKDKEAKEIAYFNVLKPQILCSSKDNAITLVGQLNAKTLKNKDLIKLNPKVSNITSDKLAEAEEAVFNFVGNNLTLARMAPQDYSYSQVDHVLISPKTTGIRLTIKGFDKYVHEVSFDGKSLRTRLKTPSTWSSYAFFLDENGRTNIFYLTADTEILLGDAKGLDLSQATQKGTSLAFIAEDVNLAKTAVAEKGAAEGIAKAKGKRSAYFLKGSSVFAPTLPKEAQAFKSVTALADRGFTIHLENNAVEQIETSLTGEKLLTRILLPETCTTHGIIAEDDGVRSLTLQKPSETILFKFKGLKEIACLQDTIAVRFSEWGSITKDLQPAIKDMPWGLKPEQAIADTTSKVVLIKGNQLIQIISAPPSYEIQTLASQVSTPQSSAFFSISFQGKLPFIAQVDGEGNWINPKWATTKSTEFNILYNPKLSLLIHKGNILAQIEGILTSDAQSGVIAFIADALTFEPDKLAVDLIKNESMNVSTVNNLEIVGKRILFVLEDNAKPTLRIAGEALLANEGEAFEKVEVTNQKQVLASIQNNKDYVLRMSLAPVSIGPTSYPEKGLNSQVRIGTQAAESKAP